MKVTHTPIRPSQAAEAANRPALTPELLAATGARYSRNNEGLEAIYSKIDPVNPDKSVDSIFKMVDYGHASIADMAPVAMFIDGVSQYLAYLLWAISPTASGQESSTRYIQYTSQSILEYELTGLSGLVSEKEYNDFVSNSFKLYDQMLNFWTEYSVKNPLAMRIPESMIKDDSPKAQKTVERLRRNFAFDRSRVLLPMPVKTNVMMVNTARNWVEVCKYLLSSDLPEAQKCGELIKAELALVTPRLIRHANKDFASSAYWEEYKKENQSYAEELKKSVPAVESGSKTSRKVEDRLVIFEKIAEEKVLANLKYRTNRYSRCGNDLSAMPVRMELSGCTLGDLRDLNRHRTGNKRWYAVPEGFYSSYDEHPGDSIFAEIEAFGKETQQKAVDVLSKGNSGYMYLTLFGHQYRFEHTVMADKFIYEAELRTGVGAHYRYAFHLRNLLQDWYKAYPATRGVVFEGSAEPE